jgi:hypothetical protein
MAEILCAEYFEVMRLSILHQLHRMKDFGFGSWRKRKKRSSQVKQKNWKKI